MPITLHIHATPKAKHSEILGWAQDEHGKLVLKVKIAAPPEDGKANDELVRFMAKWLGIPKSAVTLERGSTSRHKRLKIADESAASKLAALPTVTKA